MENNNELIKKSEIFKYTYYDDTGKLVVVLNEDYIKQLFKADVVTFNE